MTGKISEMTAISTLASSGDKVPLVRTGVSENYLYDLSADLAARTNTVATRTALAALTVRNSAYLTESGREGLFVWSSANNATNVTNDPRQGVYVAPSSDTTGASGAWVRKFSGPLDVRWFGAVADGVTDDYVALQQWLDIGGHLYLPKGEYYSSARLIARKNVVVDGDGYGFDARLVDGSFTLGYDNMPGARIRFAAGAGGIDIQPQTTVTDVATAVAAGVGGFTQEGSRYSVFRNLALIGAGTGAAATGFYSRTYVHLENVHVYKFQGKGFDISASGDAPDGNSEYGNASLSKLTGCQAISNGSHGFHLRGRDANVIKLDTCNAQSNGGWGFNDDGLLGNKYENCHAAANVSGSYRASSLVAFHVYEGCYVEFDAGALSSLTQACTVIGGSLANAAAHPANSPAFILNVGDAIRAPIRGRNDRHATNTFAGLGRSPDGENRTAIWWGDSIDAVTPDAYKLRRDFGGLNKWVINYRNALNVLEFITGSHSNYAGLADPYGIGLPYGLYMGPMDTAPRLLPAAATAPVAGTYRLGDVVPNSNPVAGGPLCWQCVVAGTPGTWRAINAPQVRSLASSASVTPTFYEDQVNITALAAGVTLENWGGTAQDGHGVAVRIKDNGTSRAIGYGTKYRAVGVTLPIATVVSKTLYLGCVYNAADDKIDVVSVAQEA